MRYFVFSDFFIVLVLIQIFKIHSKMHFITEYDLENFKNKMVAPLAKVFLCFYRWVVKI